MAEHMNQAVAPPLNPFNAMGKPISTEVRQAAYDTCRNAFGLDSARSWEVVNTTAEQLERDKPHAAVGMAMKHLDLGGSYRLMSVLLAGVAQEEQQANDKSAGSMVSPDMAMPSKTLAQHQAACQHKRLATTALGALTNTGWTCRECGALVSSEEAPERRMQNDA